MIGVITKQNLGKGCGINMTQSRYKCGDREKESEDFFYCQECFHRLSIKYHKERLQYLNSEECKQ